jgi:outer membrane protein TolC
MQCIKLSYNICQRILLVVLLALSADMNAQRVFTTPDELIDFSKENSIDLKSGEINISKAEKARLAAIANLFDPAVNTTSSFTDNTKLPVNFFPSSAFGGEPGTFTKVQTGIQYVTNLNQYADIKILNMGGWENLKLARINLESTELNNKITLKSLAENIGTTYFNIVSLQAQLKSTDENVKSAESLWKVASDKYGQGLVKQQDVNDALANLLNTKENSRQLSFLIEQNIITLKILCDIPENESIEIRHKNDTEVNTGKVDVAFSDLNLKSSLLKEQYAFNNFRQHKRAQLPTLSFFLSNTFQQNNTQFKLFDNNVDWINSNYIGLKLTFNLPSAQSITQISNARYDMLIAKKNTEQVKIKSDLEFKQLSTEMEKALSKMKSDQEIYNLRYDTYTKNQQLYSEGLIGIDQTINSYNAMLSAHYNLISAQINVQLAQTKIDINNKIR